MKTKFTWDQNHPILCAAPLHGITNSSQRRILKKFGADVVFTEMVSSMGLKYQNKKTINKTYFTKYEKPIIVQVFGHTIPETITIAQELEKNGADGLDFNCGCPARSMLASGNGGKLLQDPDKLIEILSALKKSVNIPVSLKTRIGYDKKLPPSFYQNIIKKTDIDCLTLHGRTVKQQYAGSSDWDYIKTIADKLNIPVIGNGDIIDPQQAIKYIKKYTPSGIMIGRGALGQPWIFEQIKKLLLGKKIRPKTNIKKIKKIILTHTNLLIKELSLRKDHRKSADEQAIIQMRKHFGWYIKNIPNATEIRQKLYLCNNTSELRSILQNI
ncbi:MAG: tRNA dihydrouridine synthase [Patescibacteria group bacterium]